jgi:hypothetical protein
VCVFILCITYGLDSRVGSPLSIRSCVTNALLGERLTGPFSPWKEPDPVILPIYGHITLGYSCRSVLAMEKKTEEVEVQPAVGERYRAGGAMLQ